MERPDARAARHPAAFAPAMPCHGGPDPTPLATAGRTVPGHEYQRANQAARAHAVLGQSERTAAQPGAPEFLECQALDSYRAGCQVGGIPGLESGRKTAPSR